MTVRLEPQIWMEMIQSRNKTSHTYNQEVADEIVFYEKSPAKPR